MALLANAKGAVGGLVFHRRVPPAIEVDHVRGGGQIQTRAASSERQDEKRWSVVALELNDKRLTLLHAGATVQHQAAAAKDRGQVGRQRVDDLAELGKN